jgi:hypothetical protein
MHELVEFFPLELVLASQERQAVVLEAKVKGHEQEEEVVFQRKPPRQLQ